jgi:hypothetical protein
VVKKADRTLFCVEGKPVKEKTREETDSPLRDRPDIFDGHA